jgi:phosphate:Na+ symporter
MPFTDVQNILLVFTWIVLFLYGLKSFSKEVQAVGAETMNVWLSRVTNRRWRAFLLGAGLTAIIQSSSAVSSMTVALVDAGAFSFTNSLGVLLGAKVGTTVTAWLVSLRFTETGPFFIVFGALISMVPYRVHLVGKLFFYFGFILFSLHLLSYALKPIQQSPQIVEVLRSAEYVPVAVLVGVLVTFLVQSSSVVSGLVVVLVQTGIIELNEGVGIIIGSSVGTTSTALIAALRLNEAAKLAAMANFLVNLIGTLVFIPLVGLLVALVRLITPDPAFQVAFANLIFNSVVALTFLAFMRPFARGLLRWRGGELYTREVEE